MQFRGEYWYIPDSHQLEYADGDVGHEAIADRHIYGEILGYLPVSDTDYDITYETLESAAAELYEDGELDDIFEDEIKDCKENDLDFLAEYHYSDIIIRYIKHNHENDKNIEILLNFLDGKYKGDSRKFACEFYNWIAIKGNDVICWNFNENTRKNIVTALYDVAEAEDYEYDEEEFLEMEFDISLYSNNKSYWGMTINDITNFGKETAQIHRGVELDQTDYWKKASKNWELDGVRPYYKSRPGTAPLGDNISIKPTSDQKHLFEKFNKFYTNLINK
jgi:hypothetical protein